MSDFAPRRRVLVLSFANRLARPRAFTLVELLVVIGIIAALVGILLPVLSGVQQRGRDIKCQSNLHQIVQGLLVYCAENKGVFPYGFYYEHSNVGTPDNPGDWDDATSGGRYYVSWISVLSQSMGRKNALVTDNDNIRPSVGPVFQCPEAQQAFPHLCSYAFNFIVGISPYYEVVDAGVGGINVQYKPSKTTLMLKGGTALVWDTAVQPHWENNDGFLSGADIDGQRFWSGATSPQFRYFTEHDPFGQLPPPPPSPANYGNNSPVKLNVGSNVFKNIDPPGSVGSTRHYPYQGNLRFRHNKDTACNVGWSDGHVSQFIGRINRDKTVKSHDALRRYFMTKWPTGTTPDQSFPF